MKTTNKFDVEEVREACLKKVESELDFDSSESNFLVFCIDRLVFGDDGYIDTLDVTIRQSLDDFIIGCYWLGEEELCARLAEVVSSKDLARAISASDQEFVINVMFNLMNVHHEEEAFV